MFQKAKNIDTAFQAFRRFALLVMVGSLALTGFVTYRSYQIVAAGASRIYVLAGGQAMEALASDRQENIGVEARDHVKMFHEYFFTLDPDDRVIRTNITKALYLADGSARRVYENLKENNYYSGLISGNVSQTLEVDSVAVSTRAYPYYFRLWARERITRPTSITLRSLVTEGYLRGVARSDNNPHGFLIERWTTLQNKDLKTETRL